jgi:hypothetical protein
VEIPDDKIPLILRALEHQINWLRAQRRDERPFLEIVELIRKPPQSETGKSTSKKKAG